MDNFSSVVFRVVALLFIVVPIWVAWRELAIDRRLRQSGILTDALIVESGDSRYTEANVPYLTYWFIPNDQAQGCKREQTIEKQHHRKIRSERRSTVTISYLPENPKISRLAGLDTDNTDRYRAISEAVIFTVIGLGLLFLDALGM